MIFIFYILAALLIFLSYKSFRGGINYLNYFKLELSKPKSTYTPFISIIAPCKGLDEGLERNLTALSRQDYPDYEVIFVVDNENDAAVPVIEEVSRKAAKNAEKIKLVITRIAVNSSQKVENLKEAVLQVSDNSKAFVFVDSDARPGENWLRSLVAPLQDEKIGAATGYRWFFSPRRTFASEMLAGWNASIASALGANTKTNFCWGGSMAIRRDVFEKHNIRDRWSGTLSDDFTVTRLMNEAELPIYFVPQALIATIENCTVAGLLEFTTRQMKITRVYAPKLWLMSFFGSGLFNIVLVWSFFIVIFSRENTITVLITIATLVLVTFFSISKSCLRLRAVKLVLPEHKDSLNRHFWTQNTLWAIVPALFFYNSLAALLSRKMTWRGITYRMNSPVETEILDKPESNSR